MAKIAIACSGKTLDDQVDPRFGRCPYFLIIDSKSEKFKALPNTANNLYQGAGISAVQLVLNQKVSAVIAGNFGPKAINALSQSGIKILPVSGKTAKKALIAYQTGKLKTVPASQIPSGQFRGFGQKGRCNTTGGKQK